MSIQSFLAQEAESYREADIALQSVYEKEFGNIFQFVDDLKSKIHDNQRLVTDEELEYIITTLPLNLYTAAEHLSSLKMRAELHKLEHSQLKAQKEIDPSYVRDSEMVTKMYSMLIDRVTSQISMCKELIMGAKKIWDARRSAEHVNPIAPTAPADLPDYDSMPKQYIHG